MERCLQSKQFIQTMNKVYDLYVNHGARSNKKVILFHTFIKYQLEKIFVEPIYKVEIEYNVKTENPSGFKRCDIVVIKNNTPYIIFPVKLSTSNCRQNIITAWQNLTGELHNLKKENPETHIIPIHVFMNKTPYLKKDGKIKKFEEISVKDIIIHKKLIDNRLAYDIIDYILIVEHNSNINESFLPPTILCFDYQTKFRSMSEIVKDLI